MEEFIDIGGFIERMRESLWGGMEDGEALERGLITDFDLLHGGESIQRRHAARIVHNTLLYAGEPDEEDWSAARHLADLYSCRICVNHIAQVYAKGIMKKREESVFGVKDYVTHGEAREIIMRIEDRKLRSVPEDKGCFGKTRFLPEEEARRMLGEDRKILLVDVRPSGDYALGHRPGSINIPLKDLSKNPRMICPDVKAAVFLYCAGGYQSVLAAGLLADAGYENVCVIPGLSQTN